MRDYDQLVADPATRDFQYLFAGSSTTRTRTFRMPSNRTQRPISSAPATPEEEQQLLDVVKAMLPLYLDPALDFFDYFMTDAGDPALHHAFAGS